ncbi:MAG: type II toxin-antitoxin system RelE/ParE family toxin [Desulfobulbales bacterium]|nr:type II toxin-antitoxin system RelE/ParE family toxin [Desulfobulbales bacterium]
MIHNVFLIAEAEDDIFGVYRFVAVHYAPEKAGKLFNHLRQTIDSLSELPTRGHIPPELDRIDVREFREIHFKPYRIIYQIGEANAFVHAVLDGRRELQDILQRRLLEKSGGS